MAKERKEEAERLAAEQEKLRFEAEEKARKADVEHRKAVEDRILQCLQNVCFIDEEQGRELINAINDKLIEHVAIMY